MSSICGTIALVSQKRRSGIGQRWPAPYAVAHALAAGGTVVIDLDPQAYYWRLGRSSRRRCAARNPRPSPQTGVRVLDTARNAGATLAVIDMAPREAGGAVEAARVADLVLVPCRQSAVDLAAFIRPASMRGTLAMTPTNYHGRGAQRVHPAACAIWPNMPISGRRRDRREPMSNR